MMQPVMTPEAVDRDETMTFEDYLERYDSYEGGRTEWLAGKVAVYPMANNVEHNDLLRFLGSLLDHYLEETGRGKLLTAGVPMKYSDEHPAREPDLMVIMTPHLERILLRYVNGIADIVVEVISPESDERDRGAKFLEYEAAGVPEYWLFDPLRQKSGVYVLGENGRYRELALDEKGRLVSSLLPGFVIDPAIFWQDELPGAKTAGQMVAAMLKSYLAKED